MPHTKECLEFIPPDPRIDPLILVYSDADIPAFANECEEAMFWQTHAVSERYLDEHWTEAPDWASLDEPVQFEWDEINLGHLPGSDTWGK